MSDEWISTKEAGRRLNLSVRQVVDRIHKGRLNAKRDGRKWLVHSSLLPPSEAERGGLTAAEKHLSAAVEMLKETLQDQKGQIAEKDKQIERQQIIIMQLSRDVESSQKLLEYHQAPWWRRWFRPKRPDFPDQDD